jgi:hemerythrin
MNMAITWDKSLATGSLIVDHQHQELFRQVNALSDAMKQGQGREVIGKLLDFLGQYVVRHFAEEERLMEQLDCPAAAANKQAHAQFLSTYSGLRNQFDETGAGPSLVLQIHNLLSKWLVEHIKGIDVQLRGYCDHPQQSLVGATN